MCSERRRVAVIKVDQISQAIFEQMFNALELVKDTHTFTILEVADLINGDRSANYPSGNDIVESGVLFFGTRNVSHGKLDLSETQYITKDKFATLTRGKLHRHDLVITLRGTLGQCCEFDCELETGFINAQMMIIRASEKVLPGFLLAVLMHSRMQQKLKLLASGSAVPQLTAKQIGALRVPVPDLKMQKAFMQLVEQCRVIGRNLRLQQTRMDELFGSLQHRALRGEL